MEKEKILVNYLGRRGGGAAYAYEMTKGLIEDGYFVSAIVSSGLDNLQSWKKLLLEDLYIIDTYHDKRSFIYETLKLLFIKKWKLKKAFKKIKFNYCYIPMVQPWTWVINDCVKNTKIIATLHDPITHSGGSKWLEYIYINKLVIDKADRVIILSKKFKDYVVRSYHKNKDQVIVVPHGIFDYSKYSNGIPVKRNGEYNFLFFGRIEKYKGLHLLLQAYLKLEKQYRNISLLIVGKGDIKEYESEIDKGKNINVVNRFIDDSEVVEYFHGKNIITVLPYIDATQSGVAPIAMKESSLLIVTNTGGLAEQTHNGKYALICEPDSNDLYEKMKFSIEHAEECHAIKRDAKKYADSLSWNKLAKKVMTDFEEE